MSYLPPFLRERDPDREHDMRWARDAYALRGSEDRAMRLNYGYGTQPFTVEDALVWAERRADAILGSERRWTP